MDVTYAHQLLSAAARHDVAPLQVNGRHNCKAIQDMANAGLIEISPVVGDAEPAFLIEHLTDRGQTFLRAFGAGLPNVPPPRSMEERAPAEMCTDSREATISKWRDKFVFMQMNETR